MAHAKLRKLKSSHRRRQVIVSEPKRHAMPDITYEIVQHDGGWAYNVNGAFSESFPTHAEALAAAQSAAEEQEVPGHTETIEYEDDEGNWHTENCQRPRPPAHYCQGPGLRSHAGRD